MKLLTNGERVRVDSSQATIDKWDELLKSGVKNLGFKDELIKNMYPYEGAGLTLKGTDTKLPYDEHGRLFWQMSWMDKLALAFAYLTINIGRDSLNDLVYDFRVMYDIMHQYADIIFPNVEAEDRDEAIFNALKEAKIVKLNKDTNRDSYIGPSVILTAEEKELVIRSGMANKKPTKKQEEIRDILQIKLNALHPSGSRTYRTCIPIIPALNNIFEDFPLEYFQRLVAEYHGEDRTEDLVSSLGAKYAGVGQIINEKYYCISINPIDKLMMSTNQAFGSCMSLIKEGDTRGGRNSVALALPTLFPNNSIVVGFATKGKHKNMYFDEEELRKDPKERDHSKGYKFLKMTTRMLGYMGKNIKPLGIFTTEVEESLNEITEKERLFFGRTYAKYSTNDTVYRQTIELLLDYAGIYTGYSALEKIDKYFHQEKTLSHQTVYSMLNEAILTNNNIATRDRFDYNRQVYFDNLKPYRNNFSLNSLTDTTNANRIKENPENWQVWISTDPYSRTGAGGSMSDPPAHTNCSALKVWNGEQNYAYVNSYIKMCSKCGEVAKEEELIQTEDGKICQHCYEQGAYQTCSGCGENYSALSKVAVRTHTAKPLKELISILDGTKAGDKMYCTRQATKSGAICVHCGKKHSVSWRAQNTQMSLELENGEMITLAFCDECLDKTVVCDKCKKLITIDSAENAMLLLPNKRTICFDCIDTIRLNKQRKLELLSFMDDLTQEDIDSVDTFQPSLETNLVEKSQTPEISEYNHVPATQLSRKKLLKDFRRQMRNTPAELSRISKPRTEKVQLIGDKYLKLLQERASEADIQEMNELLANINAYQEPNKPFFVKPENIIELREKLGRICRDTSAVHYYSGTINTGCAAKVNSLRDTELELIERATQEEAEDLGVPF